MAWQQGCLRPWRITIALRQAGFAGAWVNQALGVPERTVERWESGIFYPTWVDRVAIAELTGAALDELLREDDEHYVARFTRGGFAAVAEELRKHYAGMITGVVVDAHPDPAKPEALDDTYHADC